MVSCVPKLTLKPIPYAADGNRKQQDLHSFSLYLDGQDQVLSHRYPKPFVDRWLPDKISKARSLVKSS